MRLCTDLHFNQIAVTAACITLPVHITYYLFEMRERARERERKREIHRVFVNNACI